MCSSFAADNRKNKRRLFVFPKEDDYADDRNFAIDEDDYRVVDEIMSWSELRVALDARGREARNVVGVHPDDIGRRIHKIRVPPNKFLKLPPSIGRLEYLTHLQLGYSYNIESLPPSIGKLKHLKCLSLRYSPRLVELPDEIGDLTSLTTLDLRTSGIRSLPPSIGKLKNLEELFLSRTDLEELPTEIGELTGLKKLVLYDSKVKLLPDSIGRLKKNLEELVVVYFAKQPRPVLSDVLWDLTGLKVLNLQRTNIRILPERLERLTRLMYLVLDGTRMPENYGRPRIRFLLDLVDRCKYLGSIDLEGPVLAKKDALRLRTAVASNRARYRTRFGLPLSATSSVTATGSTEVGIPPKLMPHVLSNPSRAFDEYPCPHSKSSMLKWHVFGSKPDALYHLIAHTSRESFVRVLVNRGVAE